MAGYIFRSRRLYTLQELTRLEGVYTEDLDPPSPLVGIGSGNICLVAEFEDGPVNVLTEIEGGDLTRQFGGFGFLYAGVPSNNACARKRGGELWNGNGFIYSRFIRGQRFFAVRVDTAVGQVAFSPKAILKGGAGPFLLTVGDQLAITTSTGSGSSTAIAAAEASAVGSAPVTTTGFLGGEQISITLDQNTAPIIVTFGAGDQTAAAVVTRINNTVGSPIASQASGTLTLKSLVRGTQGQLTLASISPGTLTTTLKLAAGTTVGTGNVGNAASATPAELAALINGTAGLNSVGAKALVTQEGALALYDQAAASGSLLLAAGTLQVALKLPANGVAVVAGQFAGGVIPAGTRVRTAGGLEWVTQQSLTIPVGTNAAPQTGPFVLNVRPAFDDGTALGTAASTVTVLVDQPSFATFAVNNPNALNASLSEGQLDAAYIKAFDQTKDASSVAVDITYTYCARRSQAIDTSAVQVAEDSSNAGCAGRKHIRSGALGITKAQAKADRALTPIDRCFYTWPGWQVVIPEILARGAAGGMGFRDDGVVTIRAAGALAKICALLPPEENPGQQTGLIENFFATENLGYPLTPDDYADLKASGICAPRRDTTAGSIFQSGVTCDLTPARATQARRKMADFIEDTIARACVKYSKKLNTEERQDAVVAEIDSFLSSLLPNRIDSYLLDVTGNTDTLDENGVFQVVTKVRTHSSMNAIEIRTQIGEGVVTSLQVA